MEEGRTQRATAFSFMTKVKSTSAPIFDRLAPGDADKWGRYER